ncbi:hypothetical protein BH11MYX4_BH11MYX4_70040 [soil metagenome]
MADGQRRQSAQSEAYGLYVRLHWLTFDVPAGHPAHAALVAATAAAKRHWNALAAATPPGEAHAPTEALSAPPFG